MEQIIVLGLGNILYGDEGFGVRVAERLHTRYSFPEAVEIVDAGTQGYPLLAFVERAQRLLLLDAVDFGLEPGTLTERDSSGIPAYLSAHKMSLHQNSFSEVLALAELTNCLPEETRLIGLQPHDLTYGHSLSARALYRLDNAVDAALAQLTLWGVTATPRTDGVAFQAQSISLYNFTAPDTFCAP
ncbi:MAG: HyaD/HybD family hydrogenase maturation endopeptidase [Bilophila sp.]